MNRMTPERSAGRSIDGELYKIDQTGVLRVNVLFQVDDFVAGLHLSRMECALEEKIGQVEAIAVSDAKLPLDRFLCVCIILFMKLHSPSCSRCGKKNVLYRAKDDTLGCRVCGNRWKAGVK